MKAIIAFIMCIALALLMVSCSHNKREVPFQAYNISGWRGNPNKYIIWVDSSFKVGDTITSGGFSSDQYVLLQRVK